MAIRIERSGGNIISSTNTDGDITIDPNGTGTIELAAETNVTGAISATTGVTVATGQDVLSAWKNRTSYTPTVSGSGGSAGSFAATLTGEYIKAGDLVIAAIRMSDITNLGSWSGDFRFSLPFVASVAAVIAWGGTVLEIAHHTYSGQISPIIVNGHSYGRIRQLTTGIAAASLQWSNLVTTVGNDLRVLVIYTIA